MRTHPTSLEKPHNWLIYRVIHPALWKRIEAKVPGRSVDIGCGSKSYTAFTTGHVGEHAGVDIDALGDGPDIRCTAYGTPVEDGTFVAVLCTDVLEHLEKPREAHAEAFRVRGPGGYASYTVPLAWHLHEAPRDFFRFTKLGRDYLFKKIGFSIIGIQSLTGLFVTCVQDLVYMLHQVHRKLRLTTISLALPPVAHGTWGAALLLNKVERTEVFTPEYTAGVQKPGRPS